ncbi:MAG: hypothetical protein ACREV6_03890 [Clostridium sp.]|uniref:hypothetical protein n=1 Tax=Clostridium sp. TaxID=1506 RepID=UPI003D6D10D9
MYEKGDNTCTKILKDTVLDLAQNTIRAIKLLGVKGIIKVAIKVKCEIKKVVFLYP